MIQRWKLALAFGLALGAVPHGPAAAADPERGTFNVVFENDLFYGQDRDYTNGVLLSWTSRPNLVPDFLAGTARLFPLFLPTGKVRVNYGLGQNLYTPRDTSLADPP